MLNYVNGNIIAVRIIKQKVGINMENAEKIENKVTETLAKELEGLSNEGLHEFFMFFYKMS